LATTRVASGCPPAPSTTRMIPCGGTGGLADVVKAGTVLGMAAQPPTRQRAARLTEVRREATSTVLSRRAEISCGHRRRHPAPFHEQLQESDNESVAIWRHNRQDRRSLTCLPHRPRFARGSCSVDTRCDGGGAGRVAPECRARHTVRLDERGQAHGHDHAFRTGCRGPNRRPASLSALGLLGGRPGGFRLDSRRSAAGRPLHPTLRTKRGPTFDGSPQRGE
jgi:hypothetical protein